MKAAAAGNDQQKMRAAIAEAQDSGVAEGDVW